MNFPPSSSDGPGPSSSGQGPSPANLSTPNGPVVKKGVKRPAPAQPITNGNVETWEEKSNDFLCPICFEILKEAHITECGHTYCHDCIVTTIDTTSKCPRCRAVISKDNLIPNFILNHLVARQSTLKTVKKDISEAGHVTAFTVLLVQIEDTYRAIDFILDHSLLNFFCTGPEVFKFLTTDYNDLRLSDVNVLLTMLNRKKEVLTSEDRGNQRLLTLEFLSQLLKIRNTQKQKLDREVSLIQRDFLAVKATPPELNNSYEPDEDLTACLPEEGTSSSSVGSSHNHGHACFNTNVHDCPEVEQATFAARKSRMYSHFDELTAMYLESRHAEVYDDRVRKSDSFMDDEDNVIAQKQVEDFGAALSRISRYHALKPLATLSYNADLLSNSNIVSSIEFDKDNEFFAIAGVTKKIKLFEYATVLGASVDIHYPSAELSCNAKISCVAWSGYYKNSLASSDYDGCVNLWDSGSATKIRTLNEHEKRVWSVDWSNGDPRLLASGSDDSKVKLWATNQERSVAVLDAKANVCCVKFCPENSFILAFGSADHCVHYYDFRQPREPLGVLYGHKKAVSYVKFASKYELISASTDSNLKLWNLQSMESVRSFRGHINEKNFVGLATDGNFIACGSENNSLYIYYKSLPKPLFSFKFDNHRSMLDKAKPDETTEFVSAVAWKRGSPVVVAANSQGAIKLLELI